MGGGLAAAEAAQEPELFTKVVLSSPMIRPATGNILWPVAKQIAFGACQQGKGAEYVVGQHPYEGRENFETSSSTCKVRFEYYQDKKEKEPLFQTNGASYSWLYQAGRLNRYLQRKAWKQIQAPVLIFQSADGSSFSEKLSATGDALKQLLVGPLFRMGRSGTTFDFKRLTDILASLIPLIFTGLSVCVMFSANQFNLGAEGGIMLGACTTGMVAGYVPMAAFLHPGVGVLAGGLAAAAIMLLPALLKTKLNVSEMVCSLMLNYIIMYLIKYLMNTYLADKTKGQIQSYEFLETSKIAPLIDNGSKLSWGFVVAIACVVLNGLFIYNTRWGSTIRMIGINQAFAK